MDSIGMNCVKYLLFLFNLLFALSGIFLVGVGFLVQQMYDNYSAFIDEKIFTAPVLFIIVGVCIFIIAFCGCCGAIKESNNMLTIFSFMLCLVFIFEIAGGTAGYLLKDDLGEIVELKMNTSLNYYHHNLYYSRTWNFLQFDLSCCGVRSKDDWSSVFPNGSLPHSCCPTAATDEPCLPSLASPDGCLPALTAVLQHNLSIFIGFGLAIAFIQFIGVIFACCMTHSIRKYETV